MTVDLILEEVQYFEAELHYIPIHTQHVPLYIKDLTRVLIRGATIRQKVYCDILRYGKPVLQYILQYTWYLYFCLLLPLVQYYNTIQGS